MEISIVIPHYNSSDTLFRLLESIPKTPAIEIIVVDDKSNKEEIIKIQKSKYYNQIIFLENTGKKSAGSCRNIGIKHVTKKWILFADADDYFVENFFNKIEKINSVDKELIFFTPTSTYSDTNLEAMRHLEYKGLIDEYLKNKSIKNLEKLKYNFVVPWSKLIKTSLVKEKNIFFDEVIASNDIMFSIKLSYYCLNIGVSEEIIYCVTVHKGSLTLKINEEIFDSRLEVNERRNIFFKQIKKEEYISGGTSFLISSRKYGIKKFFKTFLIVSKNWKYILKNLKNFRQIISAKLQAKKNKNYYIEG